jgi:hypothetical protein
MALSETLDRADFVRNEIWRAIEGPLRTETHGSQIVMGYLSLALEHHEGIAMLLRNNLRGSALVLIRPIFEILYRAFWIATCSNPQDIEKLWRNKFEFPTVGKMVSEIDTAIGDPLFHRVKTLSWNDQNEYTHSGLFQLGSRFTEGALEAFYPDDIIGAQVEATTIVPLMLAILMFEQNNRSDDAEPLRLLVGTFSLKPNVTSAKP